MTDAKVKLSVIIGVCLDNFAPSGSIHVGSLRGVIIHDIVTQGLKGKGKKTTFQYGFDDYDPLDKFPKGLSENYQKYLGMPFSEIPAPDGKSKNYAEQYLAEFKKVFGDMGIKPEIAKSSEVYKTGKFNKR